MRRDKEEAKARGLSEIELSDEDFQEFQEAIENDVAEDQELYTEEEY